MDFNNAGGNNGSRPVIVVMPMMKTPYWLDVTHVTRLWESLRAPWTVSGAHQSRDINTALAQVAVQSALQNSDFIATYYAPLASCFTSASLLETAQRFAVSKSSSRVGLELHNKYILNVQIWMCTFWDTKCVLKSWIWNQTNRHCLNTSGARIFTLTFSGTS